MKEAAMKKFCTRAWILVAMAMLANGAQKKEADIVVCFHADNAKFGVIGPAERLATQILRDAGISVEWWSGKEDYGRDAELIDAVLSAPDEHYLPGALASAKLGVHSGTRIEVFYNRIGSSRSDATAANLLAYALVHEITHIIEGVSRHSENGIMKANWNAYDRQLIRSNSLHFAEVDLEMIHAWAEQRHNQNLIAALR